VNKPQLQIYPTRNAVAGGTNDDDGPDYAIAHAAHRRCRGLSIASRAGSSQGAIERHYRRQWQREIECVPLVALASGCSSKRRRRIARARRRPAFHLLGIEWLQCCIDIASVKCCIRFTKSNHHDFRCRGVARSRRTLSVEKSAGA